MCCLFSWQGKSSWKHFWVFRDLQGYRPCLGLVLTSKEEEHPPRRKGSILSSHTPSFSNELCKIWDSTRKVSTSSLRAAEAAMVAENASSVVVATRHLNSLVVLVLQSQQERLVLNGELLACRAVWPGPWDTCNSPRKHWEALFS